MEHIQKDDIIIRKGILHILDSHTGYLGLSSQLLEMGPDLMEFVRGTDVSCAMFLITLTSRDVTFTFAMTDHQTSGLHPGSL